LAKHRNPRADRLTLTLRDLRLIRRRLAVLYDDVAFGADGAPGIDLSTIASAMDDLQALHAKLTGAPCAHAPTQEP